MDDVKYVMIGNSTAAVGAVEAIRKNDDTGEIVIIGNERPHVYSRPLISYLLMGKRDEKRMRYRSDSFYSDNNCEVLLNRTAVKIDPDKKQVHLKGHNTPVTGPNWHKLPVKGQSSLLTPLSDVRCL